MKQTLRGPTGAGGAVGPRSPVAHGRAAPGPVQRRDAHTWSDSPRQLKQGDLLQQMQAPRAASDDASAREGALPAPLQQGIESLSGMDMSGVRVHRNSSKPAALQAHAYAQGSDIHLAPGQEKHLPHEAWHVVQQAQGRVAPTMQLKHGVAVNADAALEAEADAMGAKASQQGASGAAVPASQPLKTVQRQTAGEPLQAKWVRNKTTGERWFELDLGYQLRDDEEFEDDVERGELQPQAHVSESDDSDTSPVVVTLTNQVQTAIQVVEQVEQVLARSEPEEVPIEHKAEERPAEVRPNRPPSLRLEPEDLRDTNTPRRRVEPRAEVRNEPFGELRLDMPDQQQQHVARRKPLTVARAVSGLSAPLIDIGNLLLPAIGTTLDATGLGPAFILSVVIVVIAGLRAIAEDVKKHEDNPRSWGGRIAHTAGALIPSLMTIPMGIAGTVYGSGRMNVGAAVWIPFVFGLIAILLVHFIKLSKWIDRS